MPVAGSAVADEVKRNGGDKPRRRSRTLHNRKLPRPGAAKKKPTKPSGLTQEFRDPRPHHRDADARAPHPGPPGPPNTFHVADTANHLPRDVHGWPSHTPAISRRPSTLSSGGSGGGWSESTEDIRRVSTRRARVLLLLHARGCRRRNGESAFFRRTRYLGTGSSLCHSHLFSLRLTPCVAPARGGSGRAHRAPVDARLRVRRRPCVEKCSQSASATMWENSAVGGQGSARRL